MIFVTVGSMFPFDRLIRAMDALAAAEAAAEPAAGPAAKAAPGAAPEPAARITAQIGAGDFTPVHMPWTRRLERAVFEATVARADLVVAHAGVGSVVTALDFGKPIVLLPRRRHLGEHTSDHQVETANWLRGKPGIHVAEAEADLAACIAAARTGVPDRPGGLARRADPEFIARIRAVITKAVKDAGR